MRRYCGGLWDSACLWLSNRYNIIFLSLLLTFLVPIWAFQYFPSQDGPAHVENASILRNYRNADAGILREYYLINRELNPNWIGHLVLAGLMHVCSHLVAEKVFLTGYALLLPISIRFALTAISPANAFLSVMAFPFIYNFLLNMGFYNFCYSLPMYFFVLGYWLKNREEFHFRTAFTMSLLLILVYFCHIVSWAMAMVSVWGLVTGSIVFDRIEFSRRGQSGRQRNQKTLSKRILPVLLASLPTVFLALMFFQSQGVATSDKWGMLDLLKHLVTLSSLWSYERYELFVSSAFVCLFGCAAIPLFASKYRNRQWNDQDGLLLVCLVCVFVYLLAPDAMSGGQYLTPRLLLFPFFALLLWLGTGAFRKKTEGRIVSAASGIALVFLVLHTLKYAQLNDQLQEYMSGAHIIEENTTLLPLSFAQKGLAPDGQVLSERPRPFLFSSGYIAAEKRIVELQNYEARTEYFPVRYRPDLSPFLHIWANKGLYVSPEVDFIDYAERTGGRVDYVLLWGYREELRDEENVESIFNQLETGYLLAYTSNRGLMQLYRRKGLGEPSEESSYPD